MIRAVPTTYTEETSIRRVPMKTEGKLCREDQGTNCRILLKWILNKVAACGANSHDSGLGMVTGLAKNKQKKLHGP
jgi:hypothetical protein